MRSIWSETCTIPPRERLAGNMKTDIAVIGAGMAGIVIADALKSAGRRVTVLEARSIGSGQTKNTTAKVTSQHGLIYGKLINTLGREKARMYAASNEAAISEYRDLISRRGIDCDWEERDSFVYGQEERALRLEAESALSLGLPASFTRDVPLPVKAAGAVRFTGQAQFHPLKFLKALEEGLTVYENTPVLRVEGGDVVTGAGTVSADHVVFACHYPFINFPGLFFARMHQERSYVAALRGAEGPGGMYLGSGEERFSLRDYGGLLLLGGGGHRTGDGKVGRYALLRKTAEKWYPGCSVTARWSAQDCITPDGVPFIGRFSGKQPGWYVATGFNKWGMTSSMVSAMIIRDLILGKENENAPVFDPKRFNLASLPGVLSEAGHSAAGLAAGLFSGAMRRCTHLGCALKENRDEGTLDCPCHGSRFTGRGKLISGPAQVDLGKK